MHLCMLSILMYGGGFSMSAGIEHPFRSLNDDFLLQSSSIALHRASSQTVFSSRVLEISSCSHKVTHDMLAASSRQAKTTYKKSVKISVLSSTVTWSRAHTQKLRVTNVVGKYFPFMGYNKKSTLKFHKIRPLDPALNHPTHLTLTPFIYNARYNNNIKKNVTLFQ